MNRVGQVLDVGGSLIPGHGEAGVMAVDAGADVGLTVCHELCHPGGIRQELAGDADGVELAGANGFGTGGGCHLAGADNRDGHKVLDMADIGEVAVIGHIGRGMRPIPGVVGAVVAVEHIIAGILQEFGRFFRFGHIAPDLGIVIFTGYGALAEALCFGDDGIAEGDGESLAAGAFNGLDDFGGKTVTVFKRTAVFVGSLIGIFHGELIEHVALMDGVHLDAVHAGLHAEPGGFGEGFDNLMDFADGKGAGIDVVRPAVRGCRGAGADVIHIENRLG